MSEKMEHLGKALEYAASLGFSSGAEHRFNGGLDSAVRVAFRDVYAVGDGTPHTLNDGVKTALCEIYRGCELAASDRDDVMVAVDFIASHGCGAHAGVPISGDLDTALDVLTRQGV